MKRRAERIGGCEETWKMENKPLEEQKGAFWACVKGLRGGDFFWNSVFWGGLAFLLGRLCRIFLEGGRFSLGFSG